MRPTREELNQIKNCLNTLFENGFKEAITYNSYVTKHYWDDKDYYCENFLGTQYWLDSHQVFIKDLDLKFEWGLTKVCVINPTIENWVIKIPFDATTNPDYVEGDLVYEKDLCAAEAKFYAELVNCGLEKYVAETYHVFDIYKTPIYIQEKCEIDEDSVIQYFCDYLGNENDEDYDYYDYDYDDMDDFERIEAMIGYDDARALYNFFNYRIHDKTDGKAVLDFHEGNWGFRKNDSHSPVLIDFSGYASEDY